MLMRHQTSRIKMMNPDLPGDFSLFFAARISTFLMTLKSAPFGVGRLSPPLTSGLSLTPG
jgi:hypothetical protein